MLDLTQDLIMELIFDLMYDRFHGSSLALYQTLLKT
jgi:hypothetical protein